MTDDDIRRFLENGYERVVRVVAAVCGDRERAEDAVQESLVDVWGRRRQVDDLARWVTVAAGMAGGVCCQRTKNVLGMAALGSCP